VVEIVAQKPASTTEEIVHALDVAILNRCVTFPFLECASSCRLDSIRAPHTERRAS
jgi:hypothetical protein